MHTFDHGHTPSRRIAFFRERFTPHRLEVLLETRDMGMQVYTLTLLRLLLRLHLAELFLRRCESASEPPSLRQRLGLVGAQSPAPLIQMMLGLDKQDPCLFQLRPQSVAHLAREVLRSLPTGFGHRLGLGELLELLHQRLALGLPGLRSLQACQGVFELVERVVRPAQPLQLSLLGGQALCDLPPERSDFS